MRQICVLAPKSPRQGGRRSIKLTQNQWTIIDTTSHEIGCFPRFPQAERLIFDQFELETQLTGDRATSDGMRQIRAIATPFGRVARRWKPLAPKIALS
jgi:hypothetical protein